MPRRVLVFLVPLIAAAVIVARPAPAAAQGGAGATGSIGGAVRDDSGGVLPGVTVTATGMALMGQQVAVTGMEGLYRFPSLPAGEYMLVFDLPGFSSLTRENIRLTIGFNATVNVVLGLSSLQETVLVSGDSPTIDQTATRIQTNFTEDQLSSLPNARDMWSLLATTPSVMLNRVDVGGSNAGTQTTYYAYGYSGQNRPLVEGINTTEGTVGNGLYIDYGSFEEVFIGAAGNSAEMPNPGVMTQFVSKSGGNRLSVGAYYDVENESAQSRNLTEAQLAPNTSIRPDANRLTGYQNLNVNVGGPLVRDTLWAFGANSYQKNQVASPPNGSILDGTTFETTLRNQTGKLTYQINPSNKLIGYVQYGTKSQPYRADATNRTPSPVHVFAASTLKQTYPVWVYKGEYNRTMGQTGFFEVRAGQFGYNWTFVNNTNDTRYEDLATREVLGGGRDWENDRRRDQVTAAYSWFKDNWLGGAHNLKFGGEYLYETQELAWKQGYRDDVVHYLTNGTPTAVRLANAPSLARNGLTTVSAFVNDTWTLARLTLNVGVRFDRYTAFLPEQSLPAGRFNTVAIAYPAVDNVITFNNLVPRLGATYDLTGGGTTVVKANFGRFYFNPGVNLADSVNPNAGDQYADYVWNDRNGDRVYQEGEEGALQTRRGGAANTLLDPDLSNAYAQEASTFVERSLLGDIGLRAGYIWKKDYNGYAQVNQLRPLSAFSVPVTVVDPTTGQSIQAFNLDDLGRGSRNVTRNIPGYEGSYRTIEVSATKRYAHRWSLSASYSYIWTHEFANSYFGNTFGSGATSPFAGAYPTNPNDRTENAFTNWNSKIFGSADLGWGIRVTPVLKMQGGAPYGRYVNARLNYGSQRILVEPIGTRRQDTISLLDVRAEKQLRLGATAKLGVFFDVFNVTNSNVAVNINWLSGAAFERAVSVLPPRIAKFGLKFDW